MENKKNTKLIALIVLGLLTAFGLAVEIIMFIRGFSNNSAITNFNMIAYAVTSALLLYYAISGYKKPHGDIMKYLFLLFAICCLSAILTIRKENSTNDIIYNYIRGVVVLLTAFVAGRLDRFKQNVILMSIIGVLMLASSFIGISHWTNVFYALYHFTFFLLWVDLMFAYILRYKEHKEAGLMDKN